VFAESQRGFAAEKWPWVGGRLPPSSRPRRDPRTATEGRRAGSRDRNDRPAFRQQGEQSV